MSDRADLENAMAALDSQRTVLGDAAVEAALAGLRQRLEALDRGQGTGEALSGERRIVTVLFSDIKGSTEMAGRFDPEEWAAIMKRAMEFLISPVTRRDGTVARLMGDSILAFFGAPTAHEDDPRRAVGAGLEIASGVAEFREELRRERGLDFNVRVGINTGLVFVGAIGADRRVEYTAVGDTMNLAARMEQTAEPGTVQVTAQTFKLAEPWFDFQPLGGISVKGKDEPVIAYRAVRPKSAPPRARRLEAEGLQSPLVGRERELAALASPIQSLVAAGEGGIVAIIAEAGLGKSRLLSEARRSAGSALWLEGQTLSFGQTISYWPFQQILRAWAGITEDDDTDATWLKLDARVRDLFAEQEIEYLPYLASVLSLEVRAEEAERVRYLDGEAMGKQIFLSMRRLFERLAQSGPTVLVFEDVHWMDESSSALLQHLFPLVEGVPLLIVTLSRLDPGTPAVPLRDAALRDHVRRYTEISLAPLSDVDSRELVNRLLAIEDLPLRLLRTIVDRSEGNPFFVEEVTRTLIDAGAISVDPQTGRWRAKSGTDTVHIPDTIQGVIMARVDRLDEEVKQVLRVAAVVGRSFLYRLLQAVTEAGQHLDDDLSELQRGDLIRERQRLPELEYMFKHALAQEATYESILIQKRRELHATVGRAIESLFAERLEEFFGLLAYHYVRAEVWDKAQEYLLKAADQAGGLAGDAEALSLYEQALAAYQRAAGEQWGGVERAAIERKVGEALRRRGQHGPALDHFYRGLEYLGSPFPTARGAVRRAIAREVLIQIRTRLLARNPARHGVPSAPDRAAEEEYQLYLDLVRVLTSVNLDATLLAGLRGLNSAERAMYLLGIASGSAIIGVGLDFSSRFRVAEGYHRRALAAADANGDPRIEISAYTGAALHEAIIGRFELALEYATKAIAVARATGGLSDWAGVSRIVGQVQAWSGRPTEALAEGVDLVQLGIDASDPQIESFGEMVHGLARKAMGEFDVAAVHQQRSVELAASIPDYYSGLVSGGELAQCHLRLGDLDSASTAIAEAERLVRLYPVNGGNALIPLIHSRAERDLLAAEMTVDPEREGWLRDAAASCRSALSRIKFFPPGGPEAMLLQGRLEWLRGKPTQARRWWDKSVAEAERFPMRIDAGIAHAEIGARLGEPAELETASAIFADAGAAGHVERTEQLFREGRSA